jgi:hypothetical protein
MVVKRGMTSVEMMTAKQAAEAAKGLNFEIVWTALMENRQQMLDSQQRIEKTVADLSKNIGGLGNSLGRLTEVLFTTELWKKFNEFGFMFTQQSQHKKYTEGGKLLAEVDVFLENGEYAMLVEIKTDLSVGDVDENLERIEIIRHYMNMYNDKRKLVGAVAGGVVSENVLKYSQKKGLFVLVQTGDSVAVAAMPQGFKAHEW